MSKKEEVSDEGFPLLVIPILIGVLGLVVFLIFSVLILFTATPCEKIGETFQKSCIYSEMIEIIFSIGFWSIVLLAVSGILVAVKEWIEEQVKILNKQKQDNTKVDKNG